LVGAAGLEPTTSAV